MAIETSASRDEQISSLLEVEGEIVLFMRDLHECASMTYAEATNRFTLIHAHAAWTDLTPLASLAERVWDELEKDDNKAEMTTDERTEMRKHLITYKYLLQRLMGDYQPEIDAAMAS